MIEVRWNRLALLGPTLLCGVFAAVGVFVIAEGGLAGAVAGAFVLVFLLPSLATLLRRLGAVPVAVAFTDRGVEVPAWPKPVRLRWEDVDAVRYAPATFGGKRLLQVIATDAGLLPAPRRYLYGRAAASIPLRWVNVPDAMEDRLRAFGAEAEVRI